MGARTQTHAQKCTYRTSLQEAVKGSSNFMNNNAVISLDRVMLVSMSNLLERLVIQGAQLAYIKQSQFSKMQGFIIDSPMFS